MIDDVVCANNEIIQLLNDFLNNGNDNSEIKSKAIEIERKYAALCTINDYISGNPVPLITKKAIGFVKCYAFWNNIKIQTYSFCSHQDEWNENIGKRIASERLYEVIAKLTDQWTEREIESIKRMNKNNPLELNKIGDE